MRRGIMIPGSDTGYDYTLDVVKCEYTTILTDTIENPRRVLAITAKCDKFTRTYHLSKADASILFRVIEDGLTKTASGVFSKHNKIHSGGGKYKLTIDSHFDSVCRHLKLTKFDPMWPDNKMRLNSRIYVESKRIDYGDGFRLHLVEGLDYLKPNQTYSRTPILLDVKFSDNAISELMNAYASEAIGFRNRVLGLDTRNM